VEALRAEPCLNARPDAVTDEVFSDSEFFDARDLAQVRYDMVRRIQVDGQTVSASAADFGFFRDQVEPLAVRMISETTSSSPRSSHRCRDHPRATSSSLARLHSLVHLEDEPWR
jgi:hypothetical protein